MLRGIHKASASRLGKALMAAVMGVLVISFAIWGIGDIFRGFGQNEVAKIGGTDISIEQFRQYYNDRLQQFSRQAGRPISPDQARALGFDRQALGQLIGETTLDEQAKALRLGVSNDEVAKRITRDPNFQGSNGQFDRNRFEALIRQAGYTEARFVAEQRHDMLRRQIVQSVVGDIKVPDTAMAALNQFRNERRDIDYVVLGAAQAGEIPPPTPEDLDKYFQARKILFRAPEYRKITLLTLSPSALAKPEDVPDNAARTYYDQNKDKYGTPEKREIRQIVFHDAAEAAAVHDKIVKGASFDDLVKERGLKPSDVDLGLVTKAGIIDPAVANVAFSLAAGKVSDPVKGEFGTVLLTVGKIVPGEQKSYDEVAGEIKKEIAEAKARSALGDMRDKVEDELAAGSTLAEIAKKLGLQSVTIDAVDRSGRGPDGKPVSSLPTGTNVISAAFASDVGVDNDALQTPDGGYLYFDVEGITPARDRSLDEVKAQVESRWRDDEIGKRLAAKAKDMLDKLKSGTTLEAVATAAGLAVQKANDLQRGKGTPAAPAKLVDAVFSTAKDAAGTAEGGSETQRFVFRVTTVTVPAFDPKSFDARQLSNVLQNSYSDDLMGEYIARLESDYGVSINQAALSQVVGGSAQ